MHYVTGIALRDNALCSRMDLAKLLKKHLPVHAWSNMSMLLDVVDRLRCGHTFHVTHSSRDETASLVQAPDLVCSVARVMTDHENQLQARRAELAQLLELKERGAAGDAEAAVKFCQMNLALWYGAMAPSC